MSIPLLKLSMLNGSDNDKKQFISTLREVAHDIGFFYLNEHDVSLSLLNSVRELSKNFFLLSDEEKQSVAMINSPHFRGYNRAGNERTNGKVDWREQFDIGAEREPVNLSDSDPVWLGLHGPNQWPASLPMLKDTLLTYNDALTNISLKLLKALALGLKLPETAFDEIYGNTPNEHIKLIKYPSVGTLDAAQGVSAHKDSGLLTLILQDENKGLQVKTVDNQWVDVLPVKDTFVVNLGELLELATNGYLKATVHKVLPSEGQKERLSVAWFLGASLDSVVPVFDLPKDLISASSFIETDPDNPLLRNVGLNYMKGRLRSHPDVAEKFYTKWSSSV